VPFLYFNRQFNRVSRNDEYRFVTIDLAKLWYQRYWNSGYLNEFPFKILWLHGKKRSNYFHHRSNYVDFVWVDFVNISRNKNVRKKLCLYFYCARTN
jgi:hypothetical protein